jgi:hypothetical protein
VTTRIIAETIEVRAREPDPPRRFLPDPGDIREIAHIAQPWVSQLEIPYVYEGERRLLRIFPGGWWDSPA